MGVVTHLIDVEAVAAQGWINGRTSAPQGRNIMRKKIKIIIFGVTMAALHLTACSPATVTDAPVSPGRYTITGVAVVDVEKGIILPDQTVILEDSLIQAVGPQSELSAPQAARVIDGRGLYLMPGLVDAHVHY